MASHELKSIALPNPNSNVKALLVQNAIEDDRVQIFSGVLDPFKEEVIPVYPEYRFAQVRKEAEPLIEHLRGIGIEDHLIVRERPPMAVLKSFQDGKIDKFIFLPSPFDRGELDEILKSVIAGEHQIRFINRPSKIHNKEHETAIDDAWYRNNEHLKDEEKFTSLRLIALDAKQLTVMKKGMNFNAEFNNLPPDILLDERAQKRKSGRNGTLEYTIYPDFATVEAAKTSKAALTKALVAFLSSPSSLRISINILGSDNKPHQGPTCTKEDILKWAQGLEDPSELAYYWIHSLPILITDVTFHYKDDDESSLNADEKEMVEKEIEIFHSSTI